MLWSDDKADYWDCSVYWNCIGSVSALNLYKIEGQWEFLINQSLVMATLSTLIFPPPNHFLILTLTVLIMFSIQFLLTFQNYATENDIFHFSSKCLVMIFCIRLTTHWVFSFFPRALSWFAVGCYYYCIRKYDQSRRYFRWYSYSLWIH